MDIINSIISLGASVMMPVIFFIIALCFGVKIGTAFKAGMLVGIGFEGVGLVIGLLLTNLGPASQAMVERIGLQLMQNIPVISPFSSRMYIDVDLIRRPSDVLVK